MTQVFLPCESQQWPEDKRYFKLISSIQSVEEFCRYIEENTREETSSDLASTSQRLSCLKGLAIFLTDIASEEEKEIFFNKTLPFICRSASCLDVLIPDKGVPFIQQQEGAYVHLGCKLILSLLANAFLCTFPHEHPLGKKSKPFTFERFFKIFISSDPSRCSSQTAKLRCVLNYFYRMSYREEDGVPGTVCYNRQVIPKEDVPTLSDWYECEYPLCPVSVDNEKKIEDAGSRTLQVDFAASHIGGGALGGGRVQEEIRFIICPELIVSMLIMDAMEDNEAIIISGFERFSYYEGYAGSLKYGGDYQDPSEKDVYGNLHTTITAINAINYQNSDNQYEEDRVLRDLNKAFIGFLCRDERGDLGLQHVAMNQGEYDDIYEEELGMYDTMSQITADDEEDEEEEEDRRSDGGIESFSLSLTNDILSEVVKSVGEKAEERRCSLNSLAQSVVDNVLSDVLSKNNKDSFDEYVTRVTSSILSDVIKDLLSSSSDIVNEPMNIETEGLPSSDVESTTRSRSSSYTGQLMLPIEFTDTVVENAIHSGIIESLNTRMEDHTSNIPRPLPLPLPPPPPQVSIDEIPTSTVSDSMIDFAGKMASDILGSVINTSSPKKTIVSLSSAGGGSKVIGGAKKPRSISNQKSKNHSRQQSGHRRNYPRGSSQNDGPDNMLDPRSLYPSSSRMSVAWSTTSTRGDDSMPPSPTELDNLALNMVGTIEELSSLLADIILRDAIAMTTLPQEIQEHLIENKPDTVHSKGMSKIDTFLHSLREAGSQYSLDIVQEGLFQFSPRCHAIQKSILRPVATGNWGCGAFKGDPQLKTMLQWMAVSASGRPEMKYYPFNDKRVEQLPDVVDKILSAGINVSQLCQMVIQYCNQRTKKKTPEDLFTVLMKENNN